MLARPTKIYLATSACMTRLPAANLPLSTHYLRDFATPQLTSWMTTKLALLLFMSPKQIAINPGADLTSPTRLHRRDQMARNSGPSPRTDARAL